MSRRNVQGARWQHERRDRWQPSKTGFHQAPTVTETNITTTVSHGCETPSTNTVWDFHSSVGKSQRNFSIPCHSNLSTVPFTEPPQEVPQSAR